MKKIIILLIMIAIYMNSFSIEVTGTGSGNTEEDAKKDALSDVAYQICSEVKSEFISDIVVIDNIDVRKSDKKLVNVSTALPLLGVEILTFKTKKSYTASAVLNSTRSLPLYYSEIENIRKNIEEKYSAINNEKLKTLQKIQFAEEILKLLDAYKRHKNVLIFLGGNLEKEFAISETDIIRLINELNDKINDLDDLAEKITKDYKNYDRIFIYPLKVGNYGGVTDLSSNIKARIEKCLKNKTVNSVSDSDYIMIGEYVIKDNSLEMTYKLLDRFQNIKEVAIFSINEECYKGYRYIPENNVFYDSISADKTISNNFNIKIRLNNSYQNILFNNGDKVNVEIKMNKEGYFYIVGHNFMDKDNSYTYLLELNDTIGTSKFIFKVGEDEVNKWINIGEFTATEPFGTETLQVVGSLESINLPHYTYDIKTQLYRISGNPNDNVIQTRGLIKKKGSVFSESNITYTILN